jgi:hypothetical protein
MGDDTSKTNDGAATESAISTDAANVVALPTAITEPTFGQLSYSESEALGDTVSVRVDDLNPPGSGNVYVAWLVNTETDDTLSMGNLAVDALGNGALSLTDPEGRLLPAIFNAILITQEAAGFNGDAPSGDIMYSGGVPPELSHALSEIFITSPNGLNGDGSLFDGINVEASTAEQHAGLAASSTNVGGLLTHAEHTINILHGTQEDYNGSGRGENPGRGVGVYAFADFINEQIDAVTHAPNAPLQVMNNAEFISVCLDNTRIRADRITEVAQELFDFQGEDVTLTQDQTSEMTTLTTQLIEGLDLNENGQIEPFEGECGLDQIPTFGILFGSIDIFAGPLETE